MTAPAMRVLSLGAGVQSTTLLLLSAMGTIPRYDYAIFADTQWEPSTVYGHLDRLEAEIAAPAGIPILRVAAGNIRDDALDPKHRFASMPLFVKQRNGKKGMARRQCTNEYKIKPIKKEVRRLLGYEYPTPVPRGVHVEQSIGISTDEIGRAKAADVAYMVNRFPLLELGMSRMDCRKFLAENGFADTPKSACLGCPYSGNRHWRSLRDTCDCGHHRDDHPASGCAGCRCGGFEASAWQDVTAFDAGIRHGSARATATGSPLRGLMFLHRSRVPLSVAPIDHVTRGELRDRAAEEEFARVMEEGDPDGCSPWSCRSGSQYLDLETA